MPARCRQGIAGSECPDLELGNLERAHAFGREARGVHGDSALRQRRHRECMAPGVLAETMQQQQQHGARGFGGTSA
jgi:hypothetical protein